MNTSVYTEIDTRMESRIDIRTSRDRVPIRDIIHIPPTILIPRHRALLDQEGTKFFRDRIVTREANHVFGGNTSEQEVVHQELAVKAALIHHGHQSR